MDSAEIFSFLETKNKLPADFAKSQAYYFDADDIFYLVIYFSEKGEREFHLYSVNDFKANKAGLQELTAKMEEEYGKSSKDIFLKAEHIIEDCLRTLSAQNFFFDAH